MATKKPLTLYDGKPGELKTGDTIAGLVANGDAHDHSGGDGAQISHNSLSGLSADNHPQYAQKATLAFGQCRLVKSGAVLQLLRHNGMLLTINGAPQEIPAAGVSLSAAGLTAETPYFIYASMNGETMTLEASTTSFATDASGVKIKTGDATRTLIGMALCVAGPAWSSAAGQVISYFNRLLRSLTVTATADHSTTSTADVEASSAYRYSFLTFGEDAIVTFLGLAFGYTCVNGINFFVKADGATSMCGVNAYSSTPSNVTLTSFVQGALLSAGLHTSSMYFSAWGGDGTTTATFRAWQTRYTMLLHI